MPLRVQHLHYLSDDVLRPLLASGTLTPVMAHIVDEGGNPSFTFADYVPLRCPYNRNVWYLCKRGTHTRFSDDDDDDDE